MQTWKLWAGLAVGALFAGLPPATAGPVLDAKVTVGTPTASTPQNVQSETAVAIDAHAPNVLAAGANDFSDFPPCPQTLATQAGRCSQDVNIGLSGVYFSFDRGASWTQPTYTGWTGHDCAVGDSCTPHVGPIHTLPGYYERRFVSNGDPALAFGPVPVNGKFSWANGSRLYYANLVKHFGQQTNAEPKEFQGIFGVAVSRLDNASPARVASQDSWMPPVIASVRNSGFSLSDKEQVWADNAESSPFFGNVYVCSDDINPKSRGFATRFVINVATSNDGGESWSLKQVTSAATNAIHGSREFCSIRTDSHGVVYLMYSHANLDFTEEHVLQKSYDGGKHWTAPQVFQAVGAGCFEIDPIDGQCVMDGVGGARISNAVPNFDIANGAPTGRDATNELVNAWTSDAFGLNSEKTLVTWSTDEGSTWHDPVIASGPDVRSMYSAPAISPDGQTVYVVEEELGAPFRGDMLAPRPYRGVLRQATVGPDGAPGPWSTTYAGPWGDIRGTYPGHDLYQERVGDYVYAAAARGFGVGVWTDARNAPVCPAVQQWRQESFNAGHRLLPAPWPLEDCPAGWGNVDIWSATSG